MNDLALLAQTEEWLILNKAAGWLSVAGTGEGNDAPVLLDELRKRFGDVLPVHRLDQETSGVLLFARTRDAHAKANEWFEKRLVKKVYECIVLGRLPWPTFLAEQPIRGKRSKTQFKEKAFNGLVSWLEVLPHTGRRHQIRIHAAQNGFSLFGDSAYGGSDRLPNGAQVGRVALHASKLILPSGETFAAPPPADFKEWLKLFEQSGPNPSASSHLSPLV